MVLFDSIVSPLPYWGVRTLLPAATWFSQKVSHPGTNQAQPCLASVLGYWVIWLLATLLLGLSTILLYIAGA